MAIWLLFGTWFASARICIAVFRRHSPLSFQSGIDHCGATGLRRNDGLARARAPHESCRRGTGMPNQGIPGRSPVSNGFNAIEPLSIGFPKIRPGSGAGVPGFLLRSMSLQKFRDNPCNKKNTSGARSMPSWRSPDIFRAIGPRYFSISSKLFRFASTALFPSAWRGNRRHGPAVGSARESPIGDGVSRYPNTRTWRRRRPGRIRKPPPSLATRAREGIGYVIFAAGAGHGSHRAYLAVTLLSHTVHSGPAPPLHTTGGG